MVGDRFVPANSLVMLGVNGLHFITSLLEKIRARFLVGADLVLAVVGLVVLTFDRSDAWMYLGVSLPAAGLGQTLGSAAGGWLFGALAHRSDGLLPLPLLVMLGLLLARPRWWSAETPHPHQS